MKKDKADGTYMSAHQSLNLNQKINKKETIEKEQRNNNIKKPIRNKIMPANNCWFIISKVYNNEHKAFSKLMFHSFICILLDFIFVSFSFLCDLISCSFLVVSIGYECERAVSPKM